MKPIVFWCSLLVIAYVVVESIFLGALLISHKRRIVSYLPVRSKTVTPQHATKIRALLEGFERYITYSAQLGWTVKPNEAGTLYHSNSQGVRSHREYTPKPAPHVTRIATFGDSFTHSDGVHNHETWQAALSRLDERLEVINFGVPSFGMDQAFLRFQRDGHVYRSHIVFIGFMTENIFRHVNRYRPFYSPKTGLPLSKPRFVIENQALTLIQNPIATRDSYQGLLDHPAHLLPQLGLNDFYYQHKYHQGLFDFLPSIRYIKVISYRFFPWGGTLKLFRTIVTVKTPKPIKSLSNCLILLSRAFNPAICFRLLSSFPIKKMYKLTGEATTNPTPCSSNTLIRRVIAISI